MYMFYLVYFRRKFTGWSVTAASAGESHRARGQLADRRSKKLLWCFLYPSRFSCRGHFDKPSAAPSPPHVVDENFKQLERIKTMHLNLCGHMQGFLEVNYRSKICITVHKMLFNAIKDLLWEELIAWSKWTNKNIDWQMLMTCRTPQLDTFIWKKSHWFQTIFIREMNDY